MKGLVTGGDGFIGKHLVEELRKSGWEIDVYDLTLGKDILMALPNPRVKYDRVWHLAAQTDAQSIDPFGDAKVNILGSIRIFERYRQRVTFASSCAVLHPVTPYAISKLAAEGYARFFGCRIVRLCNIYGPGGHSVIDTFKRANDGCKKITINGSGYQQRTFTHVTHAVEALLDDRTQFRVVNGTDYTVNEIANLWAKDCKRHYQPALPTDILDGRQGF